MTAQVLNGACELLAPAGGMDALLAAVNAGADAVYVGAGRLNARVSAEGFTPRSLALGCAYAHERGARVYVALNVLVFERELDEAAALARQVVEAGADALIVADLGLAARLRREDPHIELHLSTQAGAQSPEAVRMARSLGFARVTCARELAVAEIASLAATGVPIETFCHGAICISYSGACAFSERRRGRSAMRGDCTQPCRLSYGLVDGEGRERARVSGDRLLCPRDYLGVGHVAELVEAGVSSLKIEGRMKNPDYVYNVTRAYRAALDAALAGRAVDVGALTRQLGRSFNRGFTDGYLLGRSGSDLMSWERSCNQGVRVGRVVERRHEAVRVELEAAVAAGDTLEIRFVPDAETAPDAPARWPQVPCSVNGAPGDAVWIRCKRKVSVGSVVHLVRSAEVLDETARLLDAARKEVAALERAGVARDADDAWADAARSAGQGACAGPGVAGADRGTGAPAVGCLVTEETSFDLTGPGRERPGTSPSTAVVLVDDPGEARRRLETSKGGEVAAYAWRMADDPGAWEDMLGNITVVLDEVLRPADVPAVERMCQAAARVVCRNLGEVEVARRAGADFDVMAPLYAANAEAARAYADVGARRVWLTGELSARDAAEAASELAGEVELGVVARERAELMVCEHCLLTAEGACKGDCARCERRRGARYLVERGGAWLPVRVDAHGRTRIFDEGPVERRDLVAALGADVAWAADAGVSRHVGPRFQPHPDTEGGIDADE